LIKGADYRESTIKADYSEDDQGGLVRGRKRGTRAAAEGVPARPRCIADGDRLSTQRPLPHTASSLERELVRRAVNHA